MMEGKGSLQPVNGMSWLSGFRNMFNKESGKWISTHRWLVQSILWAVLINGIASLPLLFGSSVRIGAGPEGATPEVPELFFTLMGSMTGFGVIILSQSTVVEEKNSGTAEWVLSSPLSRESFLLSKLLSNMLWMFGVLILLQGLLFEVILIIFRASIVPPLNLLKGLTLNGVNIFFWITLSLMLGSHFSSRGPVIGIPILLLLFEDIISEFGKIYVPWLPIIMPKRIVELATLAGTGSSLYSGVPIVASIIFSCLFTLIAICRFKKEEF
jgi:ABC-2 type transport system permease protein